MKKFYLFGMGTESPVGVSRTDSKSTVGGRRVEELSVEELERPKTLVFEKRVTVGDLLEILVLVVAMAIAWSRVATRDDLAKAMEVMAQTYVRSDNYALRMALIEAKMESLSGKIEEIRTDIKDIKDRVNESRLPR